MFSFCLALAIVVAGDAIVFITAPRISGRKGWRRCGVPLVAALGVISIATIAKAIFDLQNERQSAQQTIWLKDQLTGANQKLQEVSEQQLDIANVRSKRDLPKIEGNAVEVNAGFGPYLMHPGEEYKPAEPTPFVFKLGADGRLLVAGSVYDEQGDAVAMMLDSQIYVVPGFRYDINSDEDALEVLNANHHPVLQVLKAQNRKVHVYYATYQPPFTYPRPQMVFCIDGLLMGHPAAIGEEVGLPTPPLFKYPGYKHPGVRSIQNREIFKMMDDANKAMEAATQRLGNRVALPGQ